MGLRSRRCARTRGRHLEIIKDSQTKFIKSKIMNTHAEKTQEPKAKTLTNTISPKKVGGESTFQFVDNRTEAIAQPKIQEIANNGPQCSQLKAFQEMANNSPQDKQTAQLQAMVDRNSEPVLQFKPVLYIRSGKWRSDNLASPGSWDTKEEAQEAEDKVTLTDRPATPRSASFAAKQQKHGTIGNTWNNGIENFKRKFGFGIPKESQEAGNALGRVQSSFEENLRRNNPDYNEAMGSADIAGKVSITARMASTLGGSFLPPLVPVLKGVQAGAEFAEGGFKRRAATILEGSRPQSAYGRGDARVNVVRLEGKRHQKKGLMTVADALPIIAGQVSKVAMHVYDKKEVNKRNVDFSENIRRRFLNLPPIKK